MNRSTQIYVSRDGEAPAELDERQTKREGKAPAEPLESPEEPSQMPNRFIYWNSIMNHDMHPRLGRSLALPGRDQLKDELFQALEGSTR